MAWPKGVPRHPNAGRKLGVPNKSTAQVKAALEEAFTQLGGVPALIRFGEENPREFYGMWSKLLPTQVQGDPENPVALTITWER